MTHLFDLAFSDIDTVSLYHGLLMHSRPVDCSTKLFQNKFCCSVIDLSCRKSTEPRFAGDINDIVVRLIAYVYGFGVSGGFNCYNAPIT